MRLIVTGGYFDDSGECVLWDVDLADETVQTLLRWTPPEHLHVPGKGFAGGSLHASGTLYVAAHACVARIDLARAAVTGVLHQPCFNDLHHVYAADDRLYVANTGLGAVDIVGLDGAYVGSHALLPAWANARRLGGAELPRWRAHNLPWSGAAPAAWPLRDDASDYYTSPQAGLPFAQRKVRDFLHINHVQLVDGRPLATCLHDGSLRDLSSFRIVFRDETLHPHDGLFDGRSLWLTGIDGRIVELDSTSWTPRRTFDVFASGHWGWCRGLAVTEEHLIVGLTEVRAGKIPRLPWSERPPEGSETSVLAVDRARGHVVARVDLSDPARHSKIYTLLPVSQ